MYKNESKMAYLFSRDGGDGGSAVPFVCSQPSLPLSFAFVLTVCFRFPTAFGMMKELRR